MRKILTSGALILLVAFVAGCSGTFPKSPFRSASIYFQPRTTFEPLATIFVFHGVRNLSGASMKVRTSNTRIEVDESLQATEAMVNGTTDFGPIGETYSWESVVHVRWATLFVASLADKKKWEKAISDAEMEMTELMGPKKPINVRPPE